MVALLVLALLQDPESEPVRLPPPASVTLERGERSVGDLLKALREQTRVRITAKELDETRKVTIGWKDVPALRALDELCQALGAGDLQISQEEVVIDGSSARPKAVGHGDRFRFLVQNVHLTTTRRLDKATRTAGLTILVEGPPGSDISGAQTQAVIDEAVDDRGWSMIKPDTQGGAYYLASEDSEDPSAIEFDRHMMMAGRKGGTLGVQIEPPSKEAKSIELLRGRTVLTFPMRRVEGKVLVSDLTEGKEFPIGPMRIKVKSFERKGGSVTLEISTKGGSSQYGSPFPQFALVDADGKSVSRGMNGSGGGDGSFKCVYTVAEEADVAAIQYQASVGKVTKVVRFEIRNIPLPGQE